MVTIIIICSVIMIIAISRYSNQKTLGSLITFNHTDSIDFPSSESGKSYYLLLDTETSGLPKYRTEDYKQLDIFPRIIQIAFIVFDEKECMVKSDSAYINIAVHIDPSAFKVHGIHQKKLEQSGKPPEEIYESIVEEIERAKVIVVHNQGFDIPILKSELFRFGFDVEKIFEDKPVICTMESTIKFVGLKRNNGYGLKYPKLTELYGKLFYNNTNIQIKEAHDAFSDVLILARCFSELSRRQILDLDRIQKFITNREIVEKHVERQKLLLTLHSSPKSILVYGNLNENEISYLTDFNKKNIQLSILEKTGITPELSEVFKISEIQLENKKVIISLLVDFEKLILKKYPELNYKTSEITWKEINSTKFIDYQARSILSSMLKISNDLFNHHTEIDIIEKRVFIWTLNKAKGVDESQEIIQVSIPRVLFSELNLERLDPLETIRIFNPKMKFLKTKGFQTLKNLNSN